jgi:hypothetical protein
MAEELIDQYIDRGSIKEDTDFLLSQLKAVYDQFQKVKAIRINLEGSSSFKEVAAGVKKLREEEAELSKIQKQVEQTYQKRIALETEQARILAEEKELLRQRNAEIKNSIREQNAAEGSIEKLRATVIRLNKEYDNLSKAQREAGEGKALQQSILETTNELKKLEGETGRFQRNVGNYAGSFGTAFDVLKNELQAVQRQITGMADTGGTAFQELADREKLLVTLTEGLSKDFKNSSQELKTLTKAAEDLAVAFGQDAEFVQQFIAEVGEAKDTIADTRDSIKLAASDTSGFDKAIGAATALTGAFSVAEGAAALFGSENEALQETFVKLQAALTILNGLQAIQNELKNKDSILRKALNFLIAKETQLTQAQTVASRAQAGATEGATKATRGLSTALKGIGIGILLSLIPILVQAAELFSSIGDEQKNNLDTATKQADEKERELNNLKNSENILKLQGKTEEQILKLKIAGVETLKQSKKLVLETLQKNLEGQILAEKKNKELVAGFIKFLTLPTQFLEKTINAIADVLGIGKRLVLAQNLSDDLAKLFFDEKKTEEEAKKNIDAVKDEILALENEASGYQLSIENIYKQGAEKRAAAASKDNKAQFEIFKAQQEDRLKVLKEIIDNENADYDTRLKALAIFTNTSEQLIAAEQKFLLTNTELTQKEREKIEVDANIKRNNLARDFAKTKEQILQDEFDRELAIREKQTAALDAARDSFQQKLVREAQNAAGEEFKANQDSYDKQLSALENSLVNKTITLEDYYKQKEALDEEFAEKELQLQIDNARRIIEILKTAGFETAEFEKQLSALIIKEGEIRRAKNEENAALDLEQQKKLKDAKMQLSQEVFNLTQSLVDSAFVNQKNRIQEEIDLIEKRKATEIEAINASALSAEEKAARITIAEKKAQTQKEELDRRNREISLRQARFARAFQIAQILGNTALAVVGALAPPPVGLGPVLGIGLSKIIGAIGLTQIAAILANPIPKFRHGTKDAPGGYAIVGDGGQQEVVKTPDGNTFLTPATDTLVNLPQHSIVYPSLDEYREAAFANAFKPVPPLDKSLLDHQAYMINGLMKETKATRQAIENMPGITINNTWSGMKAMKKRMDGWDEYINNYVNT